MQGRYRDGIPEEEKRKLVGCLFSGAILVAPFIALLYGSKAGLFVLILALGTAVWFAWEAMGEATGPLQRRLRLLIAINAVLLIVAVGALFWLVIR